MSVWWKSKKINWQAHNEYLNAWVEQLNSRWHADGCPRPAHPQYDADDLDYQEERENRSIGGRNVRTI